MNWVTMTSMSAYGVRVVVIGAVVAGEVRVRCWVVRWVMLGADGDGLDDAVPGVRVRLVQDELVWPQ